MKKSITAVVLAAILFAAVACNMVSGRGDRIDTKEELQSYLEAENSVSAITWSPDGKNVVYLKETEGGGKKVRIWKLGSEAHSFQSQKVYYVSKNIKSKDKSRET